VSTPEDAVAICGGSHTERNQQGRRRPKLVQGCGARKQGIDEASDGGGGRLTKQRRRRVMVKDRR
jgi:hypothetical protein